MNRSSTRTGALGILGLLLAACSGGTGAPQVIPPPDPLLSTLTVSPPFGTPADGVSSVTVTATIRDSAGNPINGAAVQLTVTGVGNTLVQPGTTGSSGVATGTLSTTVGEVKAITALVSPGPGAATLGPITTTFVRILPDTYFVRTSGSDGNTGTSPVDAWQTIAYALTQVGAGDTLYVGAGTYGGSISITGAHSAASPLVLHGDFEGCFTGDAGPVIVDAGGSLFGFELAGSASFVTLRGFSSTGAANAGGVGGGFFVDGAADCALVSCAAFENERGLFVQSADRLTIESSVFSSNFGRGVQIEDADDSAFVHNLVYDNDARGLMFDGESTNLRIESNTLFRNVGDQLRENAVGSTGSIMNNVLSEGAADGLVLQAGTGVFADHNLSWAHSGSDFVGGTPSPNNSSSDPFFADPFGPDGILGGAGAADDDFRFLAGSPAFDGADRPAAQATLAFSGPFTALTSRTDDVRDGTVPDGSTLNLGFHYPVTMDPFSSLGAMGARAAYALPGEAVLRTRGWDRPTDSWTPAAETVAANQTIRWTLHRVSPILQTDEFLTLLTDTGTGTELFLHHWDGRKWTGAGTAMVPSGIQSSDSAQRGFDLEFEMVSGEALFVRSNGDQNPLFRTFSNGVWSADATVFTPALGTGAVLWIELVPRFGSDEIALLALDDQENLTASIWDGSSWTNSLLVDNRMNELRDFQAFDAAWESVSGDLFVSWGYTDLIEETRYATFEAATQTWITGQHFSTDAVGSLMRLESDPMSNMVVAAFSEGNYGDDVSIAVWSGTTWTHNVEIAPDGIAGSRTLDVGWVGNTGQALAIFERQGSTNPFEYAVFFPLGWRNQTMTPLPGVGRVVQAEMRGVPGEDRIAMLVLDENGGLFSLDFDLTNGWSVMNGGQPLATGLDTGLSTRVFSLDFRRL